MALSKSLTVVQQYSGAASSPSTVSIVSQPVVEDGVLKANPHIIRPGVFGPGTAFEGSASNPNNDSNA